MSTPLPALLNSSHDLPELRLKPREDRRIAGGHLWIFSNEVDTVRTPLTAFATGAHCRVMASNDRFLGYAYVNPHALICARILGRDPEFAPGKSLLVHRLQVALALREKLYSQPFYRLVYGESDGLPGLVLDRFGVYPTALIPIRDQRQELPGADWAGKIKMISRENLIRQHIIINYSTVS